MTASRCETSPAVSCSTRAAYARASLINRLRSCSAWITASKAAAVGGGGIMEIRSTRSTRAPRPISATRRRRISSMVERTVSTSVRNTASAGRPAVARMAAWASSFRSVSSPSTCSNNQATGSLIV